MGLTRFSPPSSSFQRTVLLAVGDAIAIGVFVAGGELRHGGSLAAGLETFTVFVIAWYVVAVPLGGFGRPALENRRRTARVVGIGWVAATVLAQVGRVFLREGSTLAPAFVLVTLGIGGGLLVGWRLIAVSALGGDGGGGPHPHNGRP